MQRSNKMKRLFSVITMALLAVGCGGGGSSNSTSQPTPTINPVNNAVNIIHVKTATAIDGDTVHVTDNKGVLHKVRLLGIDAPESDQPYGTESKNALQQCVNGQNITIQWAKKDRYDRLLGKAISSKGDCNLLQLDTGSAWFYREYQKDLAEKDKSSYANSEFVAKSGKKGLWAGSCVIKPSEWRKGNRNCATLPTPPTITNPVVPKPTQPSNDYCSTLKNKTCSQFANCTEAYTALRCGNNKIDGNKDGKPCESICK